MPPASMLGLIRYCWIRLGITVKQAATSHTAEIVRIPDASGMARRITDQMTENWMIGGGVPLTKAARQPAIADQQAGEGEHDHLVDGPAQADGVGAFGLVAGQHPLRHEPGLLDVPDDAADHEAGRARRSGRRPGWC